MGANMSTKQPSVPWSQLHKEIIQLGEDIEIDIDLSDSERFDDRAVPAVPGLVPVVPGLDLPVYSRIMTWAQCAVRITVSPENVPLQHPDYRSRHAPPKPIKGYVDLKQDVVSAPPQPCFLDSCRIRQDHEVTPVFNVIAMGDVGLLKTANIEQMNVEFFRNSLVYEDMSHAQVVSVDVGEGGSKTCVLKCVSHDIALLQKIVTIPKPTIMYGKIKPPPPN